MKEIMKILGKTFILVTTCSLFAAAFFISMFYPDSILHVDILWQILIISLLTTLSSLIFYSKRTLSKKEVLIRMMLEMAVVLIILISCALCFDWISLSRLPLFVAYVLLVIVIYLLIYSILYFSESRNADKINKKLKEFQERELNE